MTRRGMSLLLFRGRGLLLRRRGSSGSGRSAGSGARSTRGRSRARRGARGCAFGRNAGFRGSGGRGGGSGGGFGRCLHLFRVARRRHDGDEGVIERADHAHVRRQRDLAQVLRIIDLEARDVDVDRFRDVLGRTHHLDRVGHGIDGAAAFDARRLVRVDDVDRNAHPDLRAFAQPQEVDLHRQVLHRVELEVARDDPLFGAIDVELVDRGKEAPGIDALLEIGVINRDVERGLAVAVDHARHAAGSTLGAGGPLAGSRPRRRLHLLDGRRHGANPLEQNDRRDRCGPSSPQHASKRVRKRVWAAAVLARGAPCRRFGALIASAMGKDKKRALARAGKKNDGDPSAYGLPPAPSLASSAAMRAFNVSFSSRASRAMSLTASNSSRLTTSRSRKIRSAWLRNMVSNSRRTPEATPAASFISRAISSKKRLLVWVIAGLGFAFKAPAGTMVTVCSARKAGRDASVISGHCGSILPRSTPCPQSRAGAESDWANSQPENPKDWAPLPSAA